MVGAAQEFAQDEELEKGLMKEYMHVPLHEAVLQLFWYRDAP